MTLQLNMLRIARRIAASAIRGTVIIPEASYSEDHGLRIETDGGEEIIENFHLDSDEKDPFGNEFLYIRPSSEEYPISIPSFYNSRIIACICEEDSPGSNYMWITKGKVHRCQCGHFFKLEESKHPVEQALEKLRKKIGDEEFSKLQTQHKPVKNWIEYYKALGTSESDGDGE